MIIVLTLLVVILVVYVIFLEKRIKTLEEDVKTLFEIDKLEKMVIDTLHSRIEQLADVAGIKGENETC